MGRKRKKGLPINGWLILDKPEDITSTQAVGKCRWLLNAQKAGHGGTLDPLASGILPLAFGEATKTVPFVMEADKDYSFTIRWGASTATQDREGDVIAESDARPTQAEIEKVLAGFVGEIDQIPPQFSAIKVDGERAYDLARDGEDVKLEPRKVVLHEAQLESVPSEDLAVFSVTCGKGFYIRALVRDICAALDCEGHVAALRRTRVGDFHEDEAVKLSDFVALGEKSREADDPDATSALRGYLTPIEAALEDLPAFDVSHDDAAKIRQGRDIVLLPHQVDDFRADKKPRFINGEDMSRVALALHDDRALALGEVRAGRLKPFRVFST